MTEEHNVDQDEFVLDVEELEERTLPSVILKGGKHIELPEDLPFSGLDTKP